MHILVINCGSSSLKYTLYDFPSESEVETGQLDRIGHSKVHGTCSGHREDGSERRSLGSHGDAVRWVADQVAGHEIAGVGHRVVHGGERYAASVLITDDVERDIDELSSLAPLHNPPALEGIRASRETLPASKHVAVFDTAFHTTLDDRAFRYALPETLYREGKVRRYGFHGSSHRYVSERAAQLLGRDAFTGVTCHLGNGSSLTAIQDGKSVDTSMGLTPLGGIPMGTRAGDMDPAIVLHIQNVSGLNTTEVDEILNRKSGLLGLSGISNDLREVEAAAGQGDRQAELALEVVAYQVARSIGGYLSILEGATGIVFTGGIGENGVPMRARICASLKGIDLALDHDKNTTTVANEGIISTPTSGICLLIIPTREDWVIARDTYALVHDA